MPSLFKKLLLGKELSNPYVNQYHPGHDRSKAKATSAESDATQGTQQDRMRSPSPTFLEEARRLAGRDPVTGKRTRTQEQSQQQHHHQYATYAATSGQSIAQRTQASPFSSTSTPPIATIQPGNANPNPTRNTAIAHTHAHTTVGYARMSEQLQWEDEERRRAEREVGGYFAPPRPAVREFYGGA